ncbi:MAG: TonB-dependent receptor [Prevotella sp.]|nr:TonB-dependent receptor [Candidatus Prevotella equi]
MQKTTFDLRGKAMRFTQFSHKGYALFACVGRVVVIGTLSVATLQNAKAESISVRPETAADSLQRKELKLDEVVVSGSRAPLTQSEAAKIVTVITRDDIARAAVSSVNDLLKTAIGVDVRQRGSYGVQTDISVRGGNFDQITILLNGIPISSPHTGHLSADFPLTADDIERIEVLEGPSARVYGTQAFNGVINIVTRTQPKSSDKKTDVHAYANFSGGSYGYFNASGGVMVSPSHMQHHVSGGYSRSEGATQNSDFRSSRVFYQGSYTSRNVDVTAQVGYSYKPYGANTFYGASSRDQWESNERLMMALKGDITIGKVHLLPQVYWNRWYDHYQWHRGVTPGGENYHKVDAVGGSINSWIQTRLGKTSLGAEVRSEGIWSTNLGEKLAADEYRTVGGVGSSALRQYTNHDRRTNVSAFLEHNILLRQWTISLGVLGNYNSGLDSKMRFYPGVDVAYRPNDNWKLFASWNMALRMPTFTDLYYSGKGIEGNSDLKPEKASDVQIGMQYRQRCWTADVQVFYSHKTDMIDWVTYYTTDANGAKTTDNIFHSVNFQMDNVGAETNLSFLPREVFGERFPVRRIAVSYAYLSEKSKYGVEVKQSKYAMDYLRHKVVISADSRLYKKLNLSLSWHWQERTGDGNAPYGLLDGRIAWDAKHMSVYVSATNLLSKKYYDYISIEQPKRCIEAGVKFRL